MKREQKPKAEVAITHLTTFGEGGKPTETIIRHKKEEIKNNEGEEEGAESEHSEMGNGPVGKQITGGDSIFLIHD